MPKLSCWPGCRLISNPCITGTAAPGSSISAVSKRSLSLPYICQAECFLALLSPKSMLVQVHGGNCHFWHPGSQEGQGFNSIGVIIRREEARLFQIKGGEGKKRQLKKWAATLLQIPLIYMIQSSAYTSIA